MTSNPPSEMISLMSQVRYFVFVVLTYFCTVFFNSNKKSFNSSINKKTNKLKDILNVLLQMSTNLEPKIKPSQKPRVPSCAPF